MCVITVLRRFADEADSTSTNYHDVDTSICLLGEFCTIIGHSLTLFQTPQWEVCTNCDTENTIATARWSLLVHTTTDPEPPRCPKSPPPPSTIRKYNDTALLELQKKLEQRASAGQFRVLLHYILSLPEYIEKVPLIDAFGNTLGGCCGLQLGRELVKIAREHGFGREFRPALLVGLRSPKNVKL
ncbi:hypothetical protein F5X97DRAFT_321544 [Nemania serpens]|nr:hypothetical protein F5X97DRAFT_321544 [Nemania serpens]